MSTFLIPKVNKDLKIPTKLSQLINDMSFVRDSDYTHTDNNFTDSYKSMLDNNNSSYEIINEAKLASDRANLAATKAENIVMNTPKVINKYWYIYNTETNIYESTGVKAEGESFEIVKTYASISDMEADLNNPLIKVGNFVLIDSNVQDPDNSKLYVKTETSWKYLTDMSGAIGITGKSAYEIAVEQGFLGTKEEWIASLSEESKQAALKAEEVIVRVESSLNGLEEVKTDLNNLKDTLTETNTSIQSAENIRVQNENARIEAENARVAAENSRVEAENARETLKGELEGLSTTLQSTINNANTTVNNLEERVQNTITESNTKVNKLISDSEATISDIEARGNQSIAAVDEAMLEHEAKIEEINNAISNANNTVNNLVLETNATITSHINSSTSQINEAISNAETATNNANTAADSTNTAVNNANTQANRAKLLADNPPKIIDKYWCIFDETTGQYKNTGVLAEGQKGEMGTGVTIKGTLESEGSLPIDAKEGDGYLINGFLYVYVGTGGNVESNPAWSNVGEIKGPKGDPAEVTKEAVEAVLTGDITSHNHDSLYIKDAPSDTQQYVRQDAAWVAVNIATKSDLLTKVDVIEGKGLSSNDYTTEEKNKLAGIAEGANVNVNADWNATEGDALILNKPTIPTKTSELTNDNEFITKDVDNLTNYSTTTVVNQSINDLDGSLSTVAKSGSYNDLTDTPTIPTKTSELINDSTFVTDSEVTNKINTAVASVYKVKGSVANYESLPTEAVVGDVYNLLDTGANYVCITTNPITWDKLSETFDVSKINDLKLTKITSADGIYAVTADLKLVTKEEATTDCIGVAIIDRAKNIAIMLEKNAGNNASYGRNNFTWIKGTKVEGITEETSGKTNTEILKNIETTDNSKIPWLINSFLSSKDALGYNDWYIISKNEAEKLASSEIFSFAAVEDILDNIGGHYNLVFGWTSTDKDENIGYYFSNDTSINEYSKGSGYTDVRFVRDLTNIEEDHIDSPLSKFIETNSDKLLKEQYSNNNVPEGAIVYNKTNDKFYFNGHEVGKTKVNIDNGEISQIILGGGDPSRFKKYIPKTINEVVVYKSDYEHIITRIDEDTVYIQSTGMYDGANATYLFIYTISTNTITQSRYNLFHVSIGDIDLEHNAGKLSLVYQNVTLNGEVADEGVGQINFILNGDGTKYLNDKGQYVAVTGTNSGIAISDTKPSNSEAIWIDTATEGSSDVYTKEECNNKFSTKSETENAISTAISNIPLANADTGDAGLMLGSDLSTLNSLNTKLRSISEDETIMTNNNVGRRTSTGTWQFKIDNLLTITDGQEVTSNVIDTMWVDMMGNGLHGIISSVSYAQTSGFTEITGINYTSDGWTCKSNSQIIKLAYNYFSGLDETNEQGVSTGNTYNYGELWGLFICSTGFYKFRLVEEYHNSTSSSKYYTYLTKIY